MEMNAFEFLQLQNVTRVASSLIKHAQDKIMLLLDMLGEHWRSLAWDISSGVE